MDVSAVDGAIGAMTSSLQAGNAQQDAATSVLRDSLNAEQTIALELIQAISLPGVGGNLDVKA